MRRPVYRTVASISRSRGEQVRARLAAAEHALAAALRPGSLVVLEPLDRVGDDPAAAAREAQHALQRRERARRGLGRAAAAPQLVQQLGDVVDRERGDPPPPERR